MWNGSLSEEIDRLDHKQCGYRSSLFGLPVPQQLRVNMAIMNVSNAQILDCTTIIKIWSNDSKKPSHDSRTLPLDSARLTLRNFFGQHVL